MTYEIEVRQIAAQFCKDRKDAHRSLIEAVGKIQSLRNIPTSDAAFMEATRTVMHSARVEWRDRMAYGIPIVDAALEPVRLQTWTMLKGGERVPTDASERAYWMMTAACVAPDAEAQESRVQLARAALLQGFMSWPHHESD